jgi:hypothetical protein
MTAAARAALVVIAMAVIDDAFVQREPGTSGSDHLVGGLVPAALALLLAWALPRIPAVLRGFVAVAAGALAVTAGVTDGVAAIAAGGPSGDDLVATAGALAGAVLVAAGIALLWHGRRREGRRWPRRAALTVGCLVVAYLVVLPVGFAIVATHQPRRTAGPSDLGGPYERVTLRTTDGLLLSGWYVPSHNRAAVIAFPGRRGPVPAARLLVRHGYGVLLLDARGTGEKRGRSERLRLARRARRAGGADLARTARRRRPRPRRRPGPVGRRGGAAADGREDRRAPRGRVGGRRPTVDGGAARLAGHPGLAALDLADARPDRSDRGARRCEPPPGLTGLARQIPPRPVLLIRALDGNEDEVLNRVYARAADATLWEVADGGHTGALHARPAEYERRVGGFFDAALHPVLGSGMVRP